jgi:hypothetical protein
MYLIVDLVRIFNIDFVGMCIIYPHTKFHTTDPNGSLATVIKLKAIYRYHAAAILFSYILQKKLRTFGKSVSVHNFSLLYKAVLVSLPPHKFVLPWY